MSGPSKIEWTEQTWNPIVGCSIVSPGCTNCYAMRMAHRINKMTLRSHYEDTTKVVNGKAVWTGKLSRANDDILTAPLRRKKPTMYFVNSMSDLFHEDVPDEWILRLLDVIRRTGFGGGSNLGKIDRGTGEHTYQVLTKRAKRMAEFMPRLRFNQHAALDEVALYLADDGKRPIVLKNLWLGVSAERQQEADERIPHLLQTPAAIRFASCEPLLGPIDLNAYLPHPHEPPTWPKLHWIIVGGESGPGARPMHPKWARDLRDQCASADVEFFFKQWGEFAPLDTFSDCKPDAHVYRVGKKAAGRLLDGIEHNGMPA